MAKEEQQKKDYNMFDMGYHQTICLTGRDRAYTIHNYEVAIHASPSASLDSMTSGSSKVQISTITNQNWELPAHPGNMVASNNNYIAYILEGRNGYVLRVIHLVTNNRTLLKGFTGPVLDVSFSPNPANLLACVDQGGNLFIWDLDKAALVSDASNALKFHCERSSTPDHTHHRLSWCPYIPQEEEEEDGWMLAVSHGCEMEVYNLNQMHDGEITPGKFTIPSSHEKPLLDLSLSPDGGVLATSSEDGHLKFWQVNWDNTPPTTSLHDFSPHGGDPVTRLIFCDNHTTQDPLAQFWRFLITGANRNTEIKLWCTVSWKCLQTFRFLPPQDSSDPAEPNILLDLDKTASYLIATDTRRMTLYVFQLVMDGLSGQASLTSITEYLLTQPILSFIISGHTPCPTANNDGAGYSGDEEEGERVVLPEGAGRDSRLSTVLIKLHCIHTRSMQELQVKFEPPDLMGVAPDPLPIPFFSRDVFSSDLPKAPSDDEAVQNDNMNEEEREDDGEDKGDGDGEDEEEGEGEIEEHVDEEDGASSLKEFSQPTSLPSYLNPISLTGPSVLEEAFLSLPSIPGVSPKLVTPSDFLSSAMTPSMSTSSPPPLIGSSTSPSFIRSPRHFPHNPLTITTTTTKLPPPLNVSSVSASSANTMTSVTLSPSLEPSDVTLDSEIMDIVAPLEAEGMKFGEDRPNDDEVKAKSEGVTEHEKTEEVNIEEEGEERDNDDDVCQVSHDIDDLRMSQLVDPRATHPTGEESEEEAAREKFSDIFGLAQTLEQSPQGGIISDDEKQHYHQQQSHIRPQQMFTSTDKSEIVTIPSKALTPTREEGAEVVNSTGTPSKEFMEMFSQHSKRGSKATTPQGGGNEMESGYSLLQMSVSTDNAASAWPDVGTMNIPKLVTQDDDFETEGTVNTGNVLDTPPTVPEKAASEVSEVGQVGVNEEEDNVSSHEPEQDAAGFANMYELFPSALRTPKLETAVVSFLRPSETTEGETGQTLPALSDQVALEHDIPSSSVFVPIEGGGSGDEELIGEDGIEMMARVREERNGDDGDERVGTVEESTGATTPHLVEIQPSSPLQLSNEHHLLQARAGGGGGEGGGARVVGSDVRGGVTKGKGRRMKKSKPHTGVAATSARDGEPMPVIRARPFADNHLTPSPTLLTSDGAESVGVSDHTHLTQLYQLVLNQQREIAVLREEQQQGFAALHQQLEGVQRNTMEEQRSALGHHAREQHIEQKIDRVLKDKQVLDRQRQDKLISTVSQTLTSAVHVKLEKVVKAEMKNQVTPAVSRCLQEQLSSTVHQRLTATDTALKEGINQIVHSKGLPEAVGTAMASSIKNTIQGLYDETFRTVVLPAFERSSREMFRQLDDAFRRGINEYLSQLQQQFHQLNEPALHHLTGSYHSLHSLLTSQESPLFTNLQREIHSAVASTVQGVGDSVRSVVREEMETALQSHTHTLNPEIQAQEERVRIQEEIQRLIQSQNINLAFETALSTSDLSLVLYLCQQVTLEDVFDKTPCPLSQPVLLSLIQQFSVNLTDNVELKLRFLEASVLALDVSNDITKNHMTQVLRTLAQQLTDIEQIHRGAPNSASLLRLIKRLRMITERLCHPHQA